MGRHWQTGMNRFLGLKNHMATDLMDLTIAIMLAKNLDKVSAA
jgi:hypothetical protein